jgi:hypothetical protein
MSISSTGPVSCVIPTHSKPAQIRGGYVGVRRGWLLSELGIGNKQNKCTSTSGAEQNMAGWR